MNTSRQPGERIKNLYRVGAGLTLTGVVLGPALGLGVAEIYDQGNNSILAAVGLVGALGSAAAIGASGYLMAERDGRRVVREQAREDHANLVPGSIISSPAKTAALACCSSVATGVVFGDVLSAPNPFGIGLATGMGIVTTALTIGALHEGNIASRDQQRQAAMVCDAQPTAQAQVL